MRQDFVDEPTINRANLRRGHGEWLGSEKRTARD
jgi:hypothetical protein